MRNPVFLLLLLSVLLVGCASSVKYDNTFAGVGADQPLFLPSRITLFAPESIEVTDPKFAKRILTRGNDVEADSFAIGITKALKSKGIDVDLRRYTEGSLSQTADLSERVAEICSRDTSRYSLVVGMLRIVDERPDRISPCHLQNGALSILGIGCLAEGPKPSLRVEIQLYDHQRDKISRSLRLGTDSKLIGVQIGWVNIQPEGLSPMMKPIFKELADTVRVR